MTALANKLFRWHRDERGQMTVEWTLLIAAFGLPMIYVFRVMLATLAGHYGMMTCTLTLPFP
jgi:Flp pilus assembly pilin Flp